MKQTILAVILTLTLSSAAFATGNLGRSSVGVQVGFGKVELEGFDGDESIFAFGLSGNYATVKDPDLFGADISVGYQYSKFDYLDSHTFAVGAQPFLNLNQYFKPYVSVGIGFINSKTILGGDDTNVSFGLGAGFETEIIESWSINLSYTFTFVDNLDTGTFGIGTSYWFENGLGLGISYARSETDLAGIDLTADLFGLGAGYSF